MCKNVFFFLKKKEAKKGATALSQMINTRIRRENHQSP